MSSVKMRRAAVAAVLVVACAGGLASAQYSLEALPTPLVTGPSPSGLFALARGVSGNGQVIVGSSNIASSEHAVVWRRESGVWTQSLLPMALGYDGRVVGRALTASHDGSTIVGSTGRVTANTTISNVGVPAVWRDANTAAPTLTLPIALDSGLRGVATGVSSSGNAVAMWTRPRSDSTQGSRLARLDGDIVTYLTDQGLFPGTNVAASTIPSASSLSSDGTVLAGDTGVVSGTSGFTFGGGGLVALPGLSSDFRYAKVGAISGDGRVVGGTFGDRIITNSVGPGALWRDGIRQTIAPAPGVNLPNCLITGLSSNGGMGVGVSGSGLDPVNNLNSAGGLSSSIFAVLLEGNTAFDLKTVLINNGLVIPSTTYLHYANAITPDGRTIVGVGSRQIGTTNQREFVSFIATIPAPGGAAVIGVGMLMLASRRQR